MNNKVLLVSAICVLAGCAAVCLWMCSFRESRPVRRDTPSVLDVALVAGDRPARIALAEPVTPDDVFVTNRNLKSFGMNVSQSQRIRPLVNEILTDVRQKLPRMAPMELVEALRAYPVLQAPQLTGVQDAVYVEGNRLILNELKSRPVADLLILRRFLDDRREVYDSGSGAWPQIGAFVEFDLKVPRRQK